MADICAVCEEAEANPALLQDCSECGRLFHLNPYQTPGKDCGDAWMGEEPTLQFFCQPCLEASGLLPPAGALPVPTDPFAAASLFTENENASILESLMSPPAAAAGGEAPPRLAPRPPSTRRYRRVDR